ncbi:globin domain-containing protein [Streptomyces coffeae]|uniref:nitric oxide dioxygenase n=1 Tax=Streptomyces coffeae TaxID=621382 RepID=A0ABS1N8H4_9ACTN|nr:globin domain-containing protein [Streptomyces coffeae]MBL1096277.1 flavohemoprotein [Streptomyces coffeae]
MDAPTTTSSAGNDGSGGNSGEWGWFTPSRKPAEDQSPTPGRGAPDREAGERAPRRPVNPIRPVGTGAERRPQAPPPPPARPGNSAARSAPAAPAPAAPAHSAPPAGTVPPAARREEHQRSDEAATSENVRPARGTPAPGTPAPESPASGAAFTAPGNASPDAILVRRTMAEIEPVSDKVTAYFYALLFVQHPELRPLFPAAMDAQRDRLFKALLTSAKLVDDPDVLSEYLAGLGRGHRKYGTQPEHYPAVGECLIGALTHYAVNSWSAETEAAWVRAYTAISQIMIDAAAEDERKAPAWWHAEVVEHERRTSDIAVVTVRPDQPYPFLAGQYTSVETPWWPRVWRHYSFAAAPRSDGLLSFHIKAIPAGWVSSALVNRARPGDVIRLGPPTGSMTVDHSSDNGLLCLGGGTGIAPIKAMVEDVAEHGRQRTVEVFYGARNDHDLYDIDTMLRLSQAHPWLSVRPVVSDGPTNGLSGRLPDAVRQYGPWGAFDAYLSGPPGMIRSGVDALRGAGIPPDRIRHDSLEELVAAGG